MLEVNYSVYHCHMAVPMFHCIYRRTYSRAPLYPSCVSCSCDYSSSCFCLCCCCCASFVFSGATSRNHFLHAIRCTVGVVLVFADALATIPARCVHFVSDTQTHNTNPQPARSKRDVERMRRYERRSCRSSSKPANARGSKTCYENV